MSKSLAVNSHRHEGKILRQTIKTEKAVRMMKAAGNKEVTVRKKHKEEFGIN